MSKFITRVELHGASALDYANLHAKMAALNFHRHISDDAGRHYQLPTAEYYSSSELEATQVRDLATAAALETGRQAWVLVLEYKQASWLLPLLPLGS